MATVLVADDEPEIRRIIVDVLAAHGYECREAEDGEAALRAIRAARPSVVLLDLKMPRLDGMEVLARLKAEGSDVLVIVLTVHDDVDVVVEAMRRGAYDFMTKPFLHEELVLHVQHAVERDQLVREVESLRAEFGAGSLRAQMGPSAAVEKLVEQVQLVAASSYSVLITGETGTGKELVARAIHNHSVRRRGRFVALDCGAIPETLIEAELFGHERGAFTGADRRREGHFQLADGGTLFLDELANLPLGVQGKLLRVIQEREIRRLGGSDTTAVDVRVIAASNVPLDGEIRSGRFRPDLYYRLDEFAITLPPLRERAGDIPHLARRFLDEATRELKRPPSDLDAGALDVLRSYPWPGNARELRNVMRRAALLGGGTIASEHLDIVAPPGVADGAPTVAAAPGWSRSLREIADDAASRAEQEAIRQALEQTRGNKTEAARLLRVDYKTLYLKLRRYRMAAASAAEA